MAERFSHSEIIARHVPLHPDDLNFNEGASVTLAASAVRQTVVSFQVPQGFLGILRTLATGVAAAGNWDDIVWALTINQTPVHGFERIVGQIAEILHPFDALRLVIPLTANARVEIVATNTTAVAIPSVSAILRGHVFQDEVRA